MELIASMKSESVASWNDQSFQKNPPDDMMRGLVWKLWQFQDEPRAQI